MINDPIPPMLSRYDYAVIAFNSSPDGSSAIYAMIKAIGVTTPPTVTCPP